MKYYLPRPIFGYLLLSMIGSGIFCGIVIGVGSIADMDFSDGERMYILLIGFCLFALFFVVRGIYKRDYRDYIVLAKGYVEEVNFKKKTPKIIHIDVKDIRLFELIYFEGAKEPTFYNLDGGTKNLRMELELYDIPHDSILQYCKENGISPLISIIRYANVEAVKVNDARVRIQYFPTNHLAWGKSKKIPFADIASIEFVSNHPISKTEDHYFVSTHSGMQYGFSSRMVDENILAECAARNGMSIGKQYKGGKLQ